MIINDYSYCYSKILITWSQVHERDLLMPLLCSFYDTESLPGRPNDL